MQFKTLSLSLLALASSVLAVPSYQSWHTVSVTYDEAYDNPGYSLDRVACSDGSHGLRTKGYNWLGDLPRFPYVGGTAAIGGWNSDQCGTCWQLTYGHKSIYVLAIDQTQQGWNIAHRAMDLLTDGQASKYGRINANAAPVESWRCGL